MARSIKFDNRIRPFESPDDALHWMIVDNLALEYAALQSRMEELKKLAKLVKNGATAEELLEAGAVQGMDEVKLREWKETAELLCI